jgi:two-component system heavy metal sensor histidine kinase CusS
MSSAQVPEPPPAPGARPRAAPGWSLAARLTAWYAGSGFLLVALATGFLYWVLATNLDREDDELLADKAEALRVFLAERAEGIQALRDEMELERAANPRTRFLVRILDDRGRTVLESPGMSAVLPPEEFPDASPDGREPPPGADRRLDSGPSFRVLAARATLGRSNVPAYLLQVGLDRTTEEALLARYRTRLWLVLMTAVAACGAVGHQIARRALRPVRAIRDTACRIRSTTLQERIETAGLPAELFELAGTFNEMLGRLEIAFGRLAQFSADIAHELRTPVNNLRGEAEVALGQARSPEEYREVLGSCLEECARLARLIDSLLFLARAESPQAQIDRGPLDVGRELQAIAGLYEAAATEAGVRLAAATPSGLTARLDRTLFQGAVKNLVANALAHTPAGGSVTLAASADADAVHVEVTDTGAGIPAEHVPKVWDRFYRVDAARPTESGHAGLGLALVKSSVALHGGAVALESQVGKGTHVRLTFPAREPTHSC